MYISTVAFNRPVGYVYIHIAAVQLFIVDISVMVEDISIEWLILIRLALSGAYLYQAQGEATADWTRLL